MTNEQILEQLKELVRLTNQVMYSYSVLASDSSYAPSDNESRLFSHIESLSIRVERLVNLIEAENDRRGIH